jgi:excisionase family DNA binding protein
MMIERRWLKASEAATYLGIHQKSLYRALKRKQIPFSKPPGVGIRLDRLRLDRLLESDNGKVRKAGRPRKGTA